jgi:hypothetical protein
LCGLACAIQALKRNKKPALHALSLLHTRHLHPTYQKSFAGTVCKL